MRKFKYYAYKAYVLAILFTNNANANVEDMPLPTQAMQKILPKVVSMPSNPFSFAINQNLQNKPLQPVLKTDAMLIKPTLDLKLSAKKKIIAKSKIANPSLTELYNSPLF